MRPVQGNLMILTLDAYLIRLVPVRSAPAYVHQLQTKETILGSNSAINKDFNIHLTGPLPQNTSVRVYSLVYQLILYDKKRHMCRIPGKGQD